MHRGQRIGGEAVDDAAEHMARIEAVRRAVELVEIDEKLRRPVTAPRRADECTGNRLHRAIGVAVFPDEARFDRILPGDVDDGDRSGEHAAAFVDRHHFMLAQPLAAGDAAHVGIDHLDRIDVGVRLEKGFGIRSVHNHPR